MYARALYLLALLWREERWIACKCVGRYCMRSNLPNESRFTTFVKRPLNAPLPLFSVALCPSLVVSFCLCLSLIISVSPSLSFFVSLSVSRFCVWVVSVFAYYLYLYLYNRDHLHICPCLCSSPVNFMPDRSSVVNDFNTSYYGMLFWLLDRPWRFANIFCTLK